MGMAPMLVEEIKEESAEKISLFSGLLYSMEYPSSLAALSTLILVTPSSTVSSGAVVNTFPLMI